MRRLFLLLAAATWSAGSLAAPYPRPSEISEAERPTVTAAMVLLTQTRGNPPISELDRFLTELPGPTKGRGMVQMMRGGVLAALKRDGEAQLALQESIRLLPEHSGPLFAAADVMTFSQNPGAAADFFIRASRIDPELAAQRTSYDVFNIIGRTRVAGDEQRRESLINRLIEINWVGDTLDGRSALVRDAILLKLQRKDVSGARGLVSELLSPRDQYTLLAQKAAEPIWSDIEAWSGPKLEKQWPVYLREAKRRFEASSDPQDAGDYLEALVAARKDRDAVAEMFPVFTADELGIKDHALLFKAAVLAGALARRGQFEEQDALYERLGKVWPLGSTTNALNLTANHARWLLVRGLHSRSLAMIEATIVAAKKAGDEVNGDALAGMYQTSACVLAKSGRTDEAEMAAALGALSASVAPAGVAKMYQCLGQHAKAKAVLLKALGADASRPATILALQPTNLPPAPTPFAEAEQKDWDRLRGDRDIVAAVRREGRVLGFAMGEGAPAVLPD
ncbi:tetratricopeptide (TPR) repeat protein [Sphingomonas kaistensis]|uniref:Tetratricopeptide (TPR) repeat protein n=1 Tax=Sphingomonas kaistensis TaxID=298708 RepID=A0A7X5Y488_9SPHN|nr:hypothetical protein [Sphingomonas kaistensis]NJC04918.1 tetratricopeptide (TPR) repeat protein [Sphingomonas kaistensis]